MLNYIGNQLLLGASLKKTGGHNTLMNWTTIGLKNVRVYMRIVVVDFCI